METKSNDTWIGSALKALCQRLKNAGPAEIATRLRGKPPGERARIALARLRERGVTPQRLLAIPIAVHGLLQEADGYFVRDPEYRQVTVAKAAHRLASGTHKSWEIQHHDGRVVRTEKHAYPRSSGQVLRHLGKVLETEAELVIERHLEAVLELKVARYGKFNPESLAR